LAFELAEFGCFSRDFLSQGSVRVRWLTGQSPGLAHGLLALALILMGCTVAQPLQRLQVALLVRSRHSPGAVDRALEQALLVTVAGIAAGLRNSG
jgi:phosphoenolpyruvate carboxylase